MRSLSIWMAVAAIVIVAGLFLSLPSKEDITPLPKEPVVERPTKGHRPSSPPKTRGEKRLTLAEAESRDDKLHAPGEDEPFSGLVETDHPGGARKAEIPMRDGVPHGEMKYYDENGTLRIMARYDNGKLIESREWDRNGVAIAGGDDGSDPFDDLLAESENPPGTVESVAVAFRQPRDEPVDPSDGISLAELQERNGVAYRLDTNQPYTGRALRRFDDGSQWERNYQDGKRHGEFISYYPSGQLRSQENYVNGEKDGLYTTYHENGQKQFEAQIQQGRQVGIASTWSETGEVLSRWEHTEDGHRINLLDPLGQDEPPPAKAVDLTAPEDTVPEDNQPEPQLEAESEPEPADP